MTAKLRLPLSIAFLLAAALGVGFAACKQGLNERCQSSDDCESGLQCNMAEHVCNNESSGAFDADPPPDAPTDAPPDAPDAM
jgi:hypothetical protein